MHQYWITSGNDQLIHISVGIGINTGHLSIYNAVKCRLQRFRRRYSTSRARVERSVTRLIACNAKFIAAIALTAKRLNEYKCGIIIRWTRSRETIPEERWRTSLRIASSPLYPQHARCTHEAANTRLPISLINGVINLTIELQTSAPGDDDAARPRYNYLADYNSSWWTQQMRFWKRNGRY